MSLVASRRFRAVPGSAYLALTCIAAGVSPPAGAGVATTVYVNAAGTCDYPSLQAAVDDLAPGSEIRLAGASFLLPATLNVFNRQLRIAGGYVACGAPDPEGKTTLQADFADAALIAAGGNAPGALNLELRDLVLSGAKHAAGSGGALQASGQGQVNLVAVDVHDNQAQFGGGIYAAAVGGMLAVNLFGGTRIGNANDGGNFADYGGGVFCSQARMRVGHADIMSNAATEDGGGLYADGCEILSAAEDGDLRIEANRARNGGGIYAGGESKLTLRSQPLQKISISHNQAIVGVAPQRGGGVFLAGFNTALAGEGLRIDNNLARGFAAGLMLQGSEARLDRGSTSCLPGDTGCSSLSGNEVRDETGALTGSAAAAFVAGGGTPQLSLGQTRVVGNGAAGSILAVGDAGLLDLSSVLIAGNQSDFALLHLAGSGILQGDFLSIADNLFTGTAIANTSTAPLALDLRRSIIVVEPGNTHLGGSGSSAFECLNTGADGALDGTTHDPGFAGAAEGNYRLATDSPNLDQCEVDGSESEHDIAGYPRVVDRPEIPNGAGVADRGAFEDIDLLFQDGFED